MLGPARIRTVLEIDIICRLPLLFHNLTQLGHKALVKEFLKEVECFLVGLLHLGLVLLEAK